MSMKINLLPKEYRPQPAVNLPRILFTLAFIGIIFGLSIWLLGERVVLNQVTNDINRVDRELELYGQQYETVISLEQQQAEIQKKRQQLAVVVEPYISINDLMGEIIAPLPDNVWIKTIAIDGSKHISIDGRSDRMRAVAMYMMDIEAAPGFTNTNLQTIDNTTNKGLGDVFGFRLTFDMEKAGAVK